MTNEEIDALVIDAIRRGCTTDSGIEADRGIEIDKALLERSDVMVLVGPTMSIGMATEVVHASDYDVPRVCAVADAEEFPATPDEMTPALTIELVRRINAAVRTCGSVG